MSVAGNLRSRTHHTIEGVSTWAERIRRQVLQVAAHQSSVLIAGPTGTGKEIIAKSIHALSDRAAKPFVPVDCAALSGELFVGHLFGHVKGAFTGAHFTALGAFRAADGGTIFLDEIGELDLHLQAKLLRVLQERVVVPLGSHQGEAIDVRVVAATNRCLEEEIQSGQFRADLYYRLNVVSLETLPLRERPEDIEPLVYRFLHQLSVERGLPLKRLTPEALDVLRAYRWPGNVRELFHCLERAVVLSPHELLDPAALPKLSGGPSPAPTGAPAAASPAARPVADPSREPAAIPQPAGGSQAAEGSDPTAEAWPCLAEVERQHILRTLKHVDYNQTSASSLLEIDRHALRRKIRKYGITLPDRSSS